MKYGVSDYYDNDYEFNGKFRANPGGEVISNSGQAFTTIARRREGIKEGENRIYNPITKTGFLVDNAGDTARVGYNDVNYSMKSFRLPKFLNASIGVTFIESRSTTTRLYDFGSPLSNDVRPAVTRDTTSDGNKQNNAAKGSGGTGGTAAGGTQGPVPVKNVEKKIKGTNVPDGTKQAQNPFGGGSFGGGGAGGSF